MRIILLFLFALISQALTCFAQEFIEIDVKVSDHWTHKPIAQATLDIIRNDSILYSIKTDSLGQATFKKIPVDQIFDLKIQNDGYVSKLTQFDLTIKDEVRVGTVVQKMKASLFKPFEHENFSFMDTTHLIHFFISNSGNVVFIVKEKKWRQALEYCKQGYSYSESYQFVTLVDSAREEVKKQNYFNATNYYIKALEIIPDSLIKQEYMELLTYSRGYYTGLLRKTYDQLIEKADSHFSNEEFVEAHDTYKKAYELMQDSYSHRQMKICNQHKAKKVK